MPPELLGHAHAFMASDRPAVPPRGAATVILLREAGTGMEVYLLRRHLSMAFAAGMYVFPGGTVDPRDFDQAVAWAGPSASAWAERLVCDEPEARALVCAAVRETFEESGVLLAGPTVSTVVGDTTSADWEADRQGLVDRTLSFTDLLDRRGLVLRTDLLAAWAHWVTPEFEPRRYDTRFFVAAMPSGQRTQDVSGEADQVTWTRPGDALTAFETGAMAMLPPTSITLQEIADFGSPADVVSAARTRPITTVLPTMEVVDGEPRLSWSEEATE